MTYSDDNGLNWEAPISVTDNGGDIRTTISQTLDGKLWLLYSRLDPSTHYDINYRTSTDDGETWSTEQSFYAAPGPQNYGMVASADSNLLLAAFETNDAGDWNIYLTSSSNGGVNWSTPAPIVNSAFQEHQPRLLRQGNGDLWLIYNRFDPTPTLQGYEQSDLYYTQSFDGGSTWNTPTQFTFFAGNDVKPNAVLINDQPFVSFASWRWERVLSQYQIWYEQIGTTQDNNPPPAVFNCNPLKIEANVPIGFQALVDDESGVSDVKLLYSLNQAPLVQVQLYDDGLHNDENATDNIWCGAAGSFQIGDHIWYELSVTDNSNNTSVVESGGFYIPAIHNAGNIILNFLPNSQLADEGISSGSNAYWPRESGNDYLCQGALWIGTDNFGDHRVMNIHYYDEDWTRTEDTPFTLAPGVSDQDGNATFDDRYSPQRIGLKVHQESYQWSGSTRNDFIIFKYTIKNTGENGNLSNLFASVWLDPDAGNSNDDLAGFDQTRSLIYMHDSQGNPNGHLGLKLLDAGNSPHSARTYNSTEDTEPFDGYSRFQYITAGFPAISQTLADYRIMLTAQPFDLAVNDSYTVAFGIVMGSSLTDLQTNADTMEAIYNNFVVGIEDNVLNSIPTKFSLSQNYPNPFNPSTTIKYQIPEMNFVTLRVYDVLGRYVATLVNEEKPAGYYQIEFNASALSSGIYFYQFKTDNFCETKKMLLIR